MRINFSRRPALVLSVHSYNAVAGLAIVAPITAKTKGYRFEVVLPPALATQGVILSDQLKSVDWRARNATFEETVPDAIMDEVAARVTALLELR